VWLGYLNDLEKIIVGEITGLEPAFQANSLPTVVVRGYDHRHRLLRGRETRSFIQMKDSDIAKRIASAAGLRAQVTDSKVTLDYVLQHNQTNLAFLQDRARRIGYEVYVKDKILYFQRPRHTDPEAITLSLSEDIIELYPRLTTMSQVGEVVVRGWDVNKKEPIVGQAGTGQEATKMAGHNSGPYTANQAFGRSGAAAVTQPVFNQAEAEQMALGQFNDMALTYISGEGVCYGRTDVRAGIVAKIEGAGQTFSGLYYLTSAEHTMTPAERYQTRFTFQRNAA
jgi:phage protein D